MSQKRPHEMVEQSNTPQRKKPKQIICSMRYLDKTHPLLNLGIDVYAIIFSYLLDDKSSIVWFYENNPIWIYFTSTKEDRENVQQHFYLCYQKLYSSQDPFYYFIDRLIDCYFIDICPCNNCWMKYTTYNLFDKDSKPEGGCVQYYYDDSEKRKE